MRDDRSVILFGIAVLTAVLSVVMGPFSVHTYCENRPFIGMGAFAAVIVIVFLVRNRAVGRWKRILAGFAVAICLSTTVMDTWFIWYATSVCRHMLDSVSP